MRRTSCLSKCSPKESLSMLLYLKRETCMRCLDCLKNPKHSLKKESASNVMNRTVLHQHKPEVNVLGMEEVQEKNVSIQDVKKSHKES